jgi:hypothetical protein
MLNMIEFRGNEMLYREPIARYEVSGLCRTWSVRLQDR